MGEPEMKRLGGMYLVYSRKSKEASGLTRTNKWDNSKV